MSYDIAVDTLVEAMLAAPMDDAPRLVWADREGGERGELVVLQCALAAGDRMPQPDRLRMAARVNELLVKNGRAWDVLSELATTQPRAAFVRGFVEHAEVDVKVLETRSAELFERAPLLRSLHVDGTAPTINEYVDPPADDVWAEMATRLECALATLPAGKITALAAEAKVIVTGDWASPVLTFDYGDDLARIIAEAPSLAGLVSVGIYSNTLTLSAARYLARLPQLEEISVGLGKGGDAGLLRAVRAARGR